MNTSRIASIDEIVEFLHGTELVDFSGGSRKQKYHFVSNTLVKLKYFKRSKPEKGLVCQYLVKVTGYTQRQVKRLIKL